MCFTATEIFAWSDKKAKRNVPNICDTMWDHVEKTATIHQYLHLVRHAVDSRYCVRLVNLPNEDPLIFSQLSYIIRSCNVRRGDTYQYHLLKEWAHQGHKTIIDFWYKKRKWPISIPYSVYLSKQYMDRDLDNALSVLTEWEREDLMEFPRAALEWFAAHPRIDEEMLHAVNTALHGPSYTEKHEDWFKMGYSNKWDKYVDDCITQNFFVILVNEFITQDENWERLLLYCGPYSKGNIYIGEEWSFDNMLRLIRVCMRVNEKAPYEVIRNAKNYDMFWIALFYLGYKVSLPVSWTAMWNCPCSASGRYMRTNIQTHEGDHPIVVYQSKQALYSSVMSIREGFFTVEAEVPEGLKRFLSICGQLPAEIVGEVCLPGVVATTAVYVTGLDVLLRTTLETV